MRFAAWGEFNNAFEQKEYMEAYVAEDVAREMLKDPRCAPNSTRSSRTRVREEPAGAPGLLRAQHASWDERFNLYPVMRLDARPDPVPAVSAA
jgi:hypothetical protein